MPELEPPLPELEPPLLEGRTSLPSDVACVAANSSKHVMFLVCLPLATYP